VLRHLKPLGVDAAVKAIEGQTSETSAAQRQLELSLQQARYEAAHARRQYDAVDPANRLVAGELERRWNEALQAVNKLEGEIAAIVARKPSPLGERERQLLIQLGADLELAWSHPAATAATRKRILRAALSEIVVRKEGSVIDLILHWQGGDHTALQLKLRLNAAGRQHWPGHEGTISIVSGLARLMPDRQIARLLNRCGKPTGYGNGWTQERVRGFRNHHDIAVYRDGERAERGEITLDAAAEIIGVCKMTALRMIRRGDIKGQQVCAGARWVIKAEDVAAFAARKRASAPVNHAGAAAAFTPLSPWGWGHSPIAQPCPSRVAPATADQSVFTNLSRCLPRVVDGWNVAFRGLSAPRHHNLVSGMIPSGVGPRWLWGAMRARVTIEYD